MDGSQATNNVVLQPATKSNKNLVFFGLSATFFVVVLLIYIFLFLNKNQSLIRFNRAELETELFVVDDKTSAITQPEEYPLNPIITDIDYSKTDATNQSAKVLKGYFDQLDLAKHSLSFKNQFLGSQTLQLLTVNLQDISQFYCWPETVTDNDQTYDLKRLEFYVSPAGEDITPLRETERTIPLDQIETFLKQDHYLIIQLENNFDLNQVNKVQKLILLGC